LKEPEVAQSVEFDKKPGSTTTVGTTNLRSLTHFELVFAFSYCHTELKFEFENEPHFHLLQCHVLNGYQNLQHVVFGCGYGA